MRVCILVYSSLERRRRRRKYNNKQHFLLVGLWRRVGRSARPMSLHFHTSLKRTSPLLWNVRAASLWCERYKYTSYFQITESLFFFFFFFLLLCVCPIYSNSSSPFSSSSSLSPPSWLYKKLCGRFVCAQMALRCSIQRGVRILYTYTCVHTHTVYYTPLARKKKVKKKKKKAVCGRLDAWLMNAGFPPTRRNPPSAAGHPIWPHNPRAPSRGDLWGLHITSLIPPMAYQSDCLWWSYRYIKIVFLFFYFTYKLVGEMLPIDTTTSRYYYFILNIPYASKTDCMALSAVRFLWEIFEGIYIYYLLNSLYTATRGGRVLGVRQPPDLHC